MPLHRDELAAGVHRLDRALLGAAQQGDAPGQFEDSITMCLVHFLSVTRDYQKAVSQKQKTQNRTKKHQEIKLTKLSPPNTLLPSLLNCTSVTDNSHPPGEGATRAPNARATI